MMSRNCRYLCGVLAAALLLVPTPGLRAAAPGESQPAKQSIQPAATTENGETLPAKQTSQTAESTENVENEETLPEKTLKTRPLTHVSGR